MGEFSEIQNSGRIILSRRVRCFNPTNVLMFVVILQNNNKGLKTPDIDITLKNHVEPTMSFTFKPLYRYFDSNIIFLLSTKRLQKDKILTTTKEFLFTVTFAKVTVILL